MFVVKPTNHFGAAFSFATKEAADKYVEAAKELYVPGLIFSINEEEDEEEVPPTVRELFSMGKKFPSVYDLIENMSLDEVLNEVCGNV